MKKRIIGAITLVAAIGGVIYMKNNPKYKEIVQLVKNADARGFYEKFILEKDKFAFTAKAKIKDYKIDYESIKTVGEKVFARLIVNNDEKLNIDTLMENDKDQKIEEVKHSKELDDLLEEKN
ncbi:DUF1310 family protein [Gemella cuniculi]|uniref:DUF1310 family protein n=1 Tax=Gemella cuniculi TaxID=150240 RepID=UPI0003FE7A09|nr:DUF1310 family protein [Gemella cuniculi]